jgi:hypothetical protein
VGREVQQPDDAVIDKALGDIRNVRFARITFQVLFYSKNDSFFLRLVIKFGSSGKRLN